MRLSLKPKPYQPACGGKWFTTFAILPTVIDDHLVWLEKVECRMWEGGPWWKSRLEYRLPINPSGPAA